jgi:hypothetical protein
MFRYGHAHALNSELKAGSESFSLSLTNQVKDGVKIEDQEMSAAPAFLWVEIAISDGVNNASSSSAYGRINSILVVRGKSLSPVSSPKSSILTTKFIS